MHLIDRFKSYDPMFGKDKKLRLKLLEEAALESNKLAKETKHIVKAINYLQNYEDDQIKVETVYETHYVDNNQKVELIGNINVYSKRHKTLVYQTDYDGSCSVLVYYHENRDDSWENHLMKVYKNSVEQVCEKHLVLEK